MSGRISAGASTPAVVGDSVVLAGDMQMLPLSPPPQESTVFSWFRAVPSATGASWASAASAARVRNCAWLVPGVLGDVPVHVRGTSGNAASTQVMGRELFCAIAVHMPVTWLLTYTNHYTVLIMREWWKLYSCPHRLSFPIMPQVRHWG